MGSNVLKKSKVTEAIAWMESNKPELFSSISSKYKDIIELDDILGEESHNEDESKSTIDQEKVFLMKKAEFMLVTIGEMEPILKTSLVTAYQLAKRAKNWSFIGWLATTFFSVGTLTALNIPDFVDKAHWSAAGGTLSSMAGFISDHLSKVYDGEKKLSATDAISNLVDLRYELKEGRNELQLRLEYPDDKDKLDQAIARMNSACKKVSEISGLLGSLNVSNKNLLS